MTELTAKTEWAESHPPKWIRAPVKSCNGSPLPALGNPSSLACGAHHYKIRPICILASHPISHHLSLSLRTRNVSVQRFLNLPYTSASKLWSYSLLNLVHMYFLLSASGEPSHVSRPRFKGICSIKHPYFHRPECTRPLSGPPFAHQFSL